LKEEVPEIMVGVCARVCLKEGENESIRLHTAMNGGMTLSLHIFLYYLFWKLACTRFWGILLIIQKKWSNLRPLTKHTCLYAYKHISIHIAERIIKKTNVFGLYCCDWQNRHNA